MLERLLRDVRIGGDDDCRWLGPVFRPREEAHGNGARVRGLVSDEADVDSTKELALGLSDDSVSEIGERAC